MNRIFIASACVLAIVSLTRCQKSDTQLKLGNTRHCQVTKIVHTLCCGLSETMLFEYNKMGDPISITQVPTAHTGGPHYIFKYDKKHRLTELFGMYEGGTGGEVYHKYFYANEGNSNVIKDSTYFFPEFRNERMVRYHSAAASHLFYDKADRIVKDSTIYGGVNTSVTNYTYDANGNMTGRTYDNLVNVHQTNRIWMFLDRDYSVNNPFTANSYNEQGLPTSFNFSSESGSFLKFVTFMRNATISYDCK